MKNMELARERNRRWAANNPEKVKEGKRRWYVRDRERVRARMKLWREKNRERIKRTTSQEKHRVKVRAIELLGGKCAKCGFVDIRALQVDHIKSVGSKIERGTPVYRQIIRGNISNLQVLCANCNSIKRIEQKEFAAG